MKSPMSKPFGQPTEGINPRGFGKIVIKLLAGSVVFAFTDPYLIEINAWISPPPLGASGASGKSPYFIHSTHQLLSILLTTVSSSEIGF